MKHRVVFVAFAALLIAPTLAWAASPIAVLAAENFYGDVAQQIGGPDVKVTSILTNPDQDPHLFEASPSVARAVSTARIVIYNGLDYDPWMAKLLSAVAGSDEATIDVGKMVGKKPGDNPHIWYDPNTMLALAARLADELSTADPDHQSDYRQVLQSFGNRCSRSRPRSQHYAHVWPVRQRRGNRRPPLGSSGAHRGLARHHTRVLYRLADQLLDHRAERSRLSPHHSSTLAIEP